MRSVVWTISYLTVILGGFAGLIGFGVVFHTISGGSEPVAWVGAAIWCVLCAVSFYGEIAYGADNKPRK